MRSMMMGLAAFTLVFASCQNEDDVVPSGKEVANADVINFTSSTTRAAISDLPAMASSGVGFQVYGKSPASTTAWYSGIDGTATYKYTAPTWGWSAGEPQWPTTSAGYPLDFYAYFPVNANGFVATPTPATALSGAITVQTAPTAQTDFLAAKATAMTRPLIGTLSMNFNHIMSKVNFGVIAGIGTTVRVQSLIASNLKNQGTFDYMAGTWGTPSGSDTYVYYGTYFPSGTGGTTPITTFTPVLADELTANPFYTAPHSRHLMLMPQTTTTWNKTAPVANAYVGAIYRMSTLLDPNAIGYASATSHPDYTIGSTYTGPLFVKVGFPFSPSSLTWNMAQGYIYNLLIGTLASTDGYYTDTFYYDENGNRTTYQVKGRNIGDPVSAGTINFTVTVTPWIDQLPTTVN